VDVLAEPVHQVEVTDRGQQRRFWQQVKDPEPFLGFGGSRTLVDTQERTILGNPGRIVVMEMNHSRLTHGKGGGGYLAPTHEVEAFHSCNSNESHHDDHHRLSLDRSEQVIGKTDHLFRSPRIWGYRQRQPNSTGVIVNSSRSDGGPPVPATWEAPTMREALRRHDLTAVFAYLNSRGYSQRRIGAMTQQSQSEISDIMGGREVMAYSVLLRIADGLGIPRGYMGLGSYDREDHTPVENALTAGVSGVAEAEEIRVSLQHAAEVMMGTSLPETHLWWRPVPRTQTPVPDHIGDGDVRNLRKLTRVLRALDYQHGGGSCREAVLAQTDYAQAMLGAECTDEVRREVALAVADLHNLAGWVSFDIGMYSSARRHLGAALELAKGNDNLSLAANVLYRLGRVHLHRDHLNQALRFFQLGQLAAQDAEDSLTVAMLHANVAWVHALNGNSNKAITALRRAEDEFARGEGNHPAWVSFFGSADLSALTGMVYSLIPGDDNVDTAISHLTTSIEARGDAAARSTIFELTALAAARLNVGDNDDGLADGNRALDLAERVRSVRTLDRLQPLLNAAQESAADGAAELAQRIATLRGG
jgi:tetratricopeptide (TPR) repeat protein/transcriptional regulator with XRE-family HTH domain